MTPHLSRVRLISVERAEAIARAAIVGGYGKIVPRSYDPEGLMVRRYVRLSLGMDCEAPYEFVLWARYSARHGKAVKPFGIEVVSRCRKCFACKRRRALFWAGRAMSEFKLWPRTLMGTFTMSPEQHQLLDMRCIGRLAKGRVDFHRLTEGERFAEQVKEFGSEVTKWLKRLRKGDASHFKPQIRYLLVAERHDSEHTSVEMFGRPHFHILIHEKSAGTLVHGDPLLAIEDERDGEYERRMVRNRHGQYIPCAFASDESFIRKNWEFGFTKFQWCADANAAFYVCKYLSKGLNARVRCSERYGLEPRVAVGSVT